MSRSEKKAWLWLAALAPIMGALLFLAAGTPRYWEAWAYLALFFGSSAWVTAYLVRHDPALLERRLRGGPFAEKEFSQKIIMSFTSLGFIALLIVPALDRRFGWSSVPFWAAIAGDLLFLAGFYIVFLVYKENSFTSATIEVAADQRVITTGPYAVVRHPMYAGALLYLAATPVALGSYWGLLAFLALAPFLIWRLFDEERFLSTRLPGYADYCRKLRWRLIPRVF